MADLVIPKLGESISEAVIAKWLKNVGETIAVDEPVVDLETDKVSVALPAPAAGVLAEQRFAAGETVKVGEVIGVITPDTAQKSDGNGSQKTPARAEAATLGGTGALGQPTKESGGPKVIGGVVEQMDPAPRTATVPSVQKAGHDAPAAEPDATVPHSKTLPPSVRKALREGAHYETATVAQPSGPQQARAQQAPAQVPTAGEREEVVALSPLRKRIAQRLVEAQHTAAILTTFNEVNMAPVIELRNRYKDRFEKEYGVKLGFMGFFVKAAVHALKKFPTVNASIDGTDIIYHGYFDIGIAVGSPRGLVVPILRDADQMPIAEIEKQIADFGKRAQDGKLTVQELTGGTYTISNGGVFGSMLSTPIINPPQSAILGVHATRERPVVENGQIVIRPINYLAQSYDHRIIDGREAVLSLVAIKEALEDPARMLLDL
jgi:2-oxoglutarate dehydrogenase E2 component (dihydrolipoamide succinyltransferase)